MKHVLTIQGTFAIALCLACGACGSSAAPPQTEARPEKALSDEEFLKHLDAEQKAITATAAQSHAFAPRINIATFEPVYRAAKAVQGATQSGVTYVKYGELMQAFSTELGIARDHDLNVTDKKLLVLFQDAYVAYHDSHTVWTAKVQHGSVLSPQDAAGAVEIMKTYDLTPYASTGNWNADVAMQTIWIRAGGLLESATALYYGKPAPTS